MERLLATIDVPDFLAVEDRIFFQSQPDGLTPTWYLAFCVQLDRMGCIRIQRVVAAERRIALVIPHADRRSRRVAVIADGMGVNRGRYAFGDRLRPRIGEYLVAGLAR